MTRIILRNDTSNNWTTNNPVLALGEAGVESNSGKLKLGDGTTAWNDLPYVGGDKLTGGSPLKVENGVISLEIDGQTIQVNQQGQLACNLDEIGNDLTTKANTDLSNLTDAGIQVIKDNAGGSSEPVDTYTKAETDGLLDKKQDKLVPEVPLTIDTYIKSNLNGMQYSSDKSAVYTTGSNNAYIVFSGYNNEILLNESKPANTLWKDFVSDHYISIPYKLGQVAGVAQTIGSHRYNMCMAIAGRTGEDGIFYPILVWSNAVKPPSSSTENKYPAFYPKSVEFLFTSATFGSSDIDATHFTSMGTVTQVAGNTQPYGGFIQITESPDGFSVIYSYFNTNDDTQSCQRAIVTNEEYINRLKEITEIRIYPNKCDAGTTEFLTSSAAVPVADFRLYDFNGELLIGNNLNNRVNLYDISAGVEQSYLNLSIGDGLSIVDGKLTASGGGGSSVSTINEKYGIRGDYSTHYGILDCPNGLITYSATGKDITLSAGVVLQCAGSNIKTTIASAMSKSLTSTAPITLFYAGGELLECGTVDYSESEPADNGVENYQAWFKPSEQQWYFKSNDTGNVFRTLVATPLANINIVDGNITRVDYIGYRVLDDDIIANADLTNLTQNGKKKVSNLSSPSNAASTLAIPASGAVVTAPTDGYYTLTGTGKLDKHYYEGLALRGPSLKVSDWIFSTNKSYCTLEVSKGQEVSVWYNDMTINEFKFTPKIGG